MAKEKANGRQHKATYAKDKLNGGYNIRVQGPNANRFAGRVVPVVRKDGTEDNETLRDVFWTGIDEDSKQPVALYHFEPKPKDEVNQEFDF